MASKVSFQYFCKGCGGQAKKEPLKAQRDWKKMHENKSYKGLGGWKCTNGCRGHIKVERRRFVQEEEQRKAA